MTIPAPGELTALPAPTATHLAEVMRQSVAISDRIAIDVIERHADKVADGWLDVRPVVSEQEVSPLTADLRRALLAYADVRQLVTHHPSPRQGHLVRIVRRP